MLFTAFPLQRNTNVVRNKRSFEIVIQTNCKSSGAFSLIDINYWSTKDEKSINFRG